jgi:hypothetical protein
VAGPLDLPRRLAASIGNSIDAAGELPVFQQKVLEHLASMDQAMNEHLASMDRNTALLLVRIEAAERTLESISRRVPDPDKPGTLARAKDVLTGEQ